MGLDFTSDDPFAHLHTMPLPSLGAATPLSHPLDGSTSAALGAQQPKQQAPQQQATQPIAAALQDTEMGDVEGLLIDHAPHKGLLDEDDLPLSQMLRSPLKPAPLAPLPKEPSTTPKAPAPATLKVSATTEPAAAEAGAAAKKAAPPQDAGKAKHAESKEQQAGSSKAGSASAADAVKAQTAEASGKKDKKRPHAGAEEAEEQQPAQKKAAKAGSVEAEGEAGSGKQQWAGKPPELQVKESQKAASGVRAPSPKERTPPLVSAGSKELPKEGKEKDRGAKDKEGGKAAAAGATVSKNSHLADFDDLGEDAAPEPTAKQQLKVQQAPVPSKPQAGAGKAGEAEKPKAAKAEGTKTAEAPAGKQSELGKQPISQKQAEAVKPSVAGAGQAVAAKERSPAPKQQAEPAPGVASKAQEKSSQPLAPSGGTGAAPKQAAPARPSPSPSPVGEDQVVPQPVPQIPHLPPALDEARREFDGLILQLDGLCNRTLPHAAEAIRSMVKVLMEHWTKWDQLDVSLAASPESHSRPSIEGAGSASPAGRKLAADGGGAVAVGQLQGPRGRGVIKVRAPDARRLALGVSDAQGQAGMLSSLKDRIAAAAAAASQQGREAVVCSTGVDEEGQLLRSYGPASLASLSFEVSSSAQGAAAGNSGQAGAGAGGRGSWWGLQANVAASPIPGTTPSLNWASSAPPGSIRRYVCTSLASGPLKLQMFTAERQPLQPAPQEQGGNAPATADGQEQAGGAQPQPRAFVRVSCSRVRSKGATPVSSMEHVMHARAVAFVVLQLAISVAAGLDVCTCAGSEEQAAAGGKSSSSLQEQMAGCILDCVHAGGAFVQASAL